MGRSGKGKIGEIISMATGGAGAVSAGPPKNQREYGSSESYTALGLATAKSRKDWKHIIDKIISQYDIQEIKSATDNQIEELTKATLTFHDFTQTANIKAGDPTTCQML